MEEVIFPSAKGKLHVIADFSGIQNVPGTILSSGSAMLRTPHPNTGYIILVTSNAFINGMARMLVTCQKLSPIGCAGSVELERATKPLLKLGKKTFTVKKGAKGYASIKLNLKTLKLLQKNGTMRAKVIVLVKTSTKTLKVSPGVITLKATQALKNAKLKPPAPSTKVVVDP